MTNPDNGRFAQVLTEAWPAVANEIGSSPLRHMDSAGTTLLDDLPAEYLTGYAFDLGARSEHLRVSRSGPMDRNLYVGDNDQLNTSAIQRLYADGASVIINSLDKFWSPASVACRSLEALFQTVVRVNAYISPHNGAALDAHYDSHDVIILQLKGSKEWTFYNGGFEKATLHQPFDPAHSTIGEPFSSQTLREGDLLFIPRGLAHRTVSTTEVSVHLTFGLHWFTHHDLLERVIALAVHQSVGLREALPVGWTTMPPESFEKLNTVCSMLGLDAKPLIEEVQVATKRALGMSSRSRPHFDLAQREEFGPATRFRISHSAPIFVEQAGNKISVSRAGNTVLFPADEKGVRGLLAMHGHTWNRTEFASAIGIGEQSSLSVCRDLMGIGFIELVD